MTKNQGLLMYVWEKRDHHSLVSHRIYSACPIYANLFYTVLNFRFGITFSSIYLVCYYHYVHVFCSRKYANNNCTMKSGILLPINRCGKTETVCPISMNILYGCKISYCYSLFHYISCVLLLSELYIL